MMLENYPYPACLTEERACTLWEIIALICVPCHLSKQYLRGFSVAFAFIPRYFIPRYLFLGILDTFVNSIYVVFVFFFNFLLLVWLWFSAVCYMPRCALLCVTLLEGHRTLLGSVGRYLSSNLENNILFLKCLFMVKYS